MKIDHIGYAVKSIDSAVAQFETLGYSFDESIKDSFRNCVFCFGSNGGYRIELVQPMDRSKPSPVDGILKKSGGGTPYHICYKSDDFSSDIGRLETIGFKVIIPPQEAIAFGGKRVVFLMGAGIGLIEIVED